MRLLTEMLGTWLLQSGACPLTIRVYFVPIQTNVNSYQLIIDMLAYCSHRWYYFNIVVLFSLDKFVAVKGSLPILKTLVIQLIAKSWHVWGCSQPHVMMLCFCCCGSECCVPLAQLKSFHGSETSIIECLATSKLCSKLTWCSLHCKWSYTNRIDINMCFTYGSTLCWWLFYYSTNSVWQAKKYYPVTRASGEGKVHDFSISRLLNGSNMWMKTGWSFGYGHRVYEAG